MSHRPCVCVCVCVCGRREERGGGDDLDSRGGLLQPELTDKAVGGYAE